MMMSDAKKILERVARAERAARDREFVAPVLPGSSVCIRISGLVGRLRVTPRDHRGWAVLRDNGRGDAEVLRAASLSEISKYCERLPRFRFLLVERDARGWLGLRAAADARL